MTGNLPFSSSFPIIPTPKPAILGAQTQAQPWRPGRSLSAQPLSFFAAAVRVVAPGHGEITHIHGLGPSENPIVAKLWEFCPIFWPSSSVGTWKKDSYKPQRIFNHVPFEPHFRKVQLPTFSHLPCGNHTMLVYQKTMGNKPSMLDKKNMF